MIGRNVRVGKDELDIVARRGSVTVVAEVKTGTGRSDPIESIDDEKLANILRAIDRLGLHGARVDGIAVEVSRRVVQVRWFEGVATGLWR